MSSTQIVAGAPNAITARIQENCGYAALYATGACIANSAFAKPDLGLVTMTEMAEEVRRICDAVSVPVIADADTGFGGPLNVARTVTAFERVGSAAVQIEDQVQPKRCGHFDGTEVVSPPEMIERIEAARRARTNPDLVIIARTDARASLGLDEAIRRARLYHRAGADVLFVDAPRSVDELREIGRRAPSPLLVNIVEDGRTPALTLEELDVLGYSLALYANTALRLSIGAVQSGMQELRRTGSPQSLADRIASWQERQRIVGLDRHVAWEEELSTYARDSDASGG